MIIWEIRPYTSANCSAPKELSDKCVDASGAHYAECKCGTGGPGNTLEKGKAYEVHPVHAKTLIKLGRATEKR